MSALVRPQRSPLPLDEIRDPVLASGHAAQIGCAQMRLVETTGYTAVAHISGVRRKGDGHACLSS
jgi:hypothetical protein